MSKAHLQMTDLVSGGPGRNDETGGRGHVHADEKRERGKTLRGEQPPLFRHEFGRGWHHWHECARAREPYLPRGLDCGRKESSPEACSTGSIQPGTEIQLTFIGTPARPGVSPSQPSPSSSRSNEGTNERRFKHRQSMPLCIPRMRKRRRFVVMHKMGRQQRAAE